MKMDRLYPTQKVHEEKSKISRIKQILIVIMQ